MSLSLHLGIVNVPGTALLRPFAFAADVPSTVGLRECGDMLSPALQLTAALQGGIIAPLWGESQV